ncbi:MAG: prepilin-type N-terminal cleavage/methylation domain-containing protein [Planctomycetes bacterium]|nr:prepilin-type N-terminal cleavage/methylation domain-containing protein [Planctomycetota bacterium]
MRSHGAASAQAGFTILELLVVTGVLAVLFGIGIGFLGRTDPNQVAASILSGETRAAQLTARAEGLPTEVFVTPGRDGESATVQGRVLQPVVSWRFEPSDGVVDDLLRASIGGEDEPRGRFGHARRPGGESNTALLRWDIKKEAADFSEGFALRFDLRLERRTACTVLRFGSAVDLQLDAELRPQARFRVRTSADGTQGAQVRSERSLPLGRWCTLDVVCDGRQAWLSLDGRELGRVITEGRPLLEPQEALLVSPIDAPIPGVVDEFRVYAHVFSPPQFLPNELQPEQPYRFAYDSQGEAIATPEVHLLLGGERQ